MLVEFFPEPNHKLVSRVSWTADINTLLGLITAFPSAVFSLTVEAAANFPEHDQDYKGEDVHRRALNNAIRMAGFMIESLEVLVSHRTFLPPSEIDEILDESFSSLVALQIEKNRTINRTHRMLGENFGSATGFQTTDYNDDIIRIRKLKREQETSEASA